MAKKVKAKKAKKAAPKKKSGAAKKPAKKAGPKKATKAKAKPVKKATKKIVAKKITPKKSAAKKVSVTKIAETKPLPKKPEVKPIAKMVPIKPMLFTRPNSIIAKTAKVLPIDNRSRYSDAELKEFKLLIQSKLDEATRDYELLKNTLSHKDDHGTDDTSPTFKLLEDGSDVLSKEETAHLAARQEKYIQNLKNAQIRIANKTYGICRVTGKLIPKERLRSVPHATLSIDAKLGQSR